MAELSTNNPMPPIRHKPLLIYGLCLVAAFSAWIMICNNKLQPAWYLVLISLAGFTIICGQVVTGRKLGAFIDERNVMSLSRFQIILWTLLVLSAYLVAALHNIFLEHNVLADPLKNGGALSIGIPEPLWWLMGISTASLAGSPLILGTKITKAADAAEVRQTYELLKQRGDNDNTLATKGHILVYTDISKARWSDIITGEEVGNAAHLDVARLQLLFFTLITALAYATLLGRMFSGNVSHGITGLPALDQSMVALIAISHAGYLSVKAVPHSKSV